MSKCSFKAVRNDTSRRRNEFVITATEMPGKFSGRKIPGAKVCSNAPLLLCGPFYIVDA